MSPDLECFPQTLTQRRFLRQRKGQTPNPFREAQANKKGLYLYKVYAI